MRRLLIAGLLLGAAVADAKKAPKCNISTDAAARKLYRKLTGEQLETRRPCIDRSDTFKGLVRFGSFADDRGCKFHTMVYQCKLADDDTPRKAMVAAGWKKADVDAKKALALAWLTEVERRSIVWREPDGDTFAGHTFIAPEATLGADGSLTLRYWEGSHGMRKGGSMTLRSLVFGADGAIVSQTDEETFGYE